MNNTIENANAELVINKLDSYIQILAEKLGVAAEYVYPLFVKQQIIDAYTSIALSVFSLAVFVTLLILGVKKKEKNNHFKDEVISKFLMTLMGAVGSIISFFAVILCLESGIPKIINPEYAAIQAIIQAVK